MEFPEHSFAIPGRPVDIFDAVFQWRKFGNAATNAHREILRLDTGAFQGPEGDLFREGINRDLPNQLLTTGLAFEKVGDALNEFGMLIVRLQEAMRPLRIGAQEIWQRLTAARTRMQIDDSPDARRSLSEIEEEWYRCLGHATELRNELEEGRRTTVREIKAAKDTRFKPNPGPLDLRGKVLNFARDHRELLKKLSSGLKFAAITAGLLALTPLAGPVLAAVMFATAASALVIDGLVYGATGDGSPKDLLLDTVLLCVPSAAGATVRLIKIRGRVLTGKQETLAENVSKLEEAVRSYSDTGGLQRETVSPEEEERIRKQKQLEDLRERVRLGATPRPTP